MNQKQQVSCILTAILLLLLNCSCHTVAPGYELSRAEYEIDTKVAKFPGKLPVANVGPLYRINGFLNRANARERTGIYITEPYDPDKIPVLFVHGLLSDPYAWDKVTKRLSQDPEISENYQFWYYAYPSATPIIGSAAIFKLHMDTYVAALEKEHGRSLDRRIVVVGHSMGGILAKSAVSGSESKLWNAAFKVPADQLSLSEEKKDLVKKAFVYAPRPYIGKAIFIAAPHRGSKVAEQTLGLIGIGLADPPDVIEEIIEELISPENAGNIQPEFLEYLKNPVNSVASLQPSAPTSKLLADLPIDDGISFHSIAGRNGEKRSDGIVPIASTIIKGALSEIIIDSNHEVQKRKETAQIINLILKNNVGLLDDKTLRTETHKIRRLQALDR